MRQQVHALRVLIDDLFELAQIDADHTAFETYGVPVGPLVESSVEAFAAEASARRISLERRVAAGDIDTVIVAFCDMQGRLLGKRVHGQFFVDHGVVAGPAAVLARELEQVQVPETGFMVHGAAA